MNTEVEELTGTDLYRRVIAFNHGDDRRNDLVREVWKPTPWMVNVYSDSILVDRHLDILDWLYQRFGPECSVIHGHGGTWQRGHATVDGWTWYGFATQAQMQAFLTAWPTPEGVKEP